MCICVCLYISVSAGSKGEILGWPTVKSRLCILVGLFCTLDLFRRGRFCTCVQEMDSQGEFPVACTVLCSSYPCSGCMLDGFRWAKKWEVILLPRGAAGVFSQKWVTASGAGTKQWSLAPSVGWSLVSARCCSSWVLWHQVSKEVWGGCWCSVPGPLWQGASGPASETARRDSGPITKCWYSPDTMLFAEWDLQVDVAHVPHGGMLSRQLFLQVGRHSKGQYLPPRLLSFKNAWFQS